MLVSIANTTYSFLCLRCTRTWSATYEVRVAHDRAGNEWRMYFRASEALTSPEVGAVCPGCGGLRVKLLPATAHHPGEAGTDLENAPNLRSQV